MIVTLDTNVLLAGLISANGASNFILHLILEEKIKLALSTSVVLEYDDVLKRPDTRRLHKLAMTDIDDIIDTLLLLARKHAIYYRLRPNLVDEGDNLIFECAFTSNSDFLITSNIKNFKNAEWRGAGFGIVTPSDFCKLWRSRHE
jgi:putative PIN family toxin of toxin-antitoxin system